VNILVIGRGGQLARALRRRAEAEDLPLEAIGRPTLDLENAEAAAAAIRSRKPSIVINAAAYTAVDDAERDEPRAQQINAIGPSLMARAAADIGAVFCHVSTDYVFSGDKSDPYVEDDRTGPLSAYGRTKLAGEQGVSAAHPGALILRTAWVYDSSGTNFVRTMLKLASQNAEVAGVCDERGSPTFATDLADAALKLCQRNASGIYHCAGVGEASRAEFAEQIYAASQARGGPSARVRHVTAAEFAKTDAKAALRAKRPANSRLNCSKLKGEHEDVMRDWRAALDECVAEIAADGWRL